MSITWQLAPLAVVHPTHVPYLLQLLLQHQGMLLVPQLFLFQLSKLLVVFLTLRLVLDRMILHGVGLPVINVNRIDGPRYPPLRSQEGIRRLVLLFVPADLTLADLVWNGVDRGQWIVIGVVVIVQALLPSKINRLECTWFSIVASNPSSSFSSCTRNHQVAASIDCSPPLC